MLRSRIVKRIGVLLATLGLLGGQLSPAYATMVGTTTALQEAQHSVERAELLAMLDREGVQSQLQTMGVDAEAAKQRVAAMTDEEVRELNAQLAEMPAGGDALGIIVLLFVVFVITDMLGATDIFPFVHPIR